MQTAHIDDVVRLKMSVKKVCPGLYIFRRKTSNNGKDWVTEFGVDALDFTMWIHLPSWIAKISRSKHFK